MHPILFEIGGYPVASYGVALTAAFAVGLAVALRRGRLRGLDEGPLLDAGIAAIVASLLGSRLLWAITHPERFRAPNGSWSQLLDPFQEGGLAGLSMLGGVVLAAAAVLSTLRWRGAPVLRSADVLAPSVLLGEAIGRVGCFLNGCCHGLASSLPWAVSFPAGSAASQLASGAALHPTQIYASLLSLLGFLATSRLLREPPFPGAVLAAMAVWIGAQRMLLDLVRHHDASTVLRELSWGTTSVALTTNHLFSGALLVAGLLAWGLARRRASAAAEGASC